MSTFLRRSGPRNRDLPDPQADTTALVPVLRLGEDFILTRSGTCVVLFELGALDTGPGGRPLEEWMERFSSALERLPPGTRLQMCLQLELWDPLSDLSAFLEAARTWQERTRSGTERSMAQAEALAAAARGMTACTAWWFDATRPVTWRTLLTLSWTPPGSTLPRWKPQEHPAGQAVPAREALERQSSLLGAAFAEAGLPLRRLTVPEMAQRFWNGLHPTASGRSQDRASDLALSLAGGDPIPGHTPPEETVWSSSLSPEDLAHLLAPDTVLEHEDSLVIDGVHLRGYILHDFRPNQPALVHRLSDLPGGWSGSLFLRVADPGEVASQLREREVQLSAMELLKASRGVLQNFSNQQEAAAVQQQRLALETVGQTPVYLHFLLLRSAPDAHSLEQRCRELESLLTTLNISAFPARYNQLPLWLSTLPGGELQLRQKPRNMTPHSLSTFFWPTRPRLAEEGGLYLGIDQHTSLPVRLDPFGSARERTPSFLALGRPGAGKSVWLRTMMLSALLSGGRVLAVDLEGEMQPFCEHFGGRYIPIGSLTGERINLLDLPPDEGNPLEYGTRHLIAFCEAVRGQAIPKGAAWNALAEAYRLALIDRRLIDPVSNQALRDWKAEDAPLLRDVVRILSHSRSPEGTSLAEMLHPYALGLYADQFNTPTSFRVRDEALVVFGLPPASQSGWDQELQVHLWQVLGFIWGEVLRRSDQNLVPNHLMLDEAWALLRTPGGAAAIENMARRFRKRRAALWMASQQVGEFLDNEHSRQILAVIGSRLLMGVNAFEARRLQGPFELSDFQVEQLTRLGHGEGLLQTPGATLRLRVLVPEDVGVL